MDLETLTALLRGQHFSVSDRTARGAWPHPPLRFSDLVRRVVQVLEEEGCFPAPSCLVQPGAPIPEGGVIVKLTGNRYVYRYQRPQASNSYTLAEKSELVFSTAEEAADHYLVWDLHLPGDLDGWKVIR